MQSGHGIKTKVYGKLTAKKKQVVNGEGSSGKIPETGGGKSSSTGRDNKHYR